jgi:hypothetical protein
LAFAWSCTSRRRPDAADIAFRGPEERPHPVQDVGVGGAGTSDEGSPAGVPHPMVAKRLSSGGKRPGRLRADRRRGPTCRASSVTSSRIASRPGWRTKPGGDAWWLKDPDFDVVGEDRYVLLGSCGWWEREVDTCCSPGRSLLGAGVSRSSELPHGGRLRIQLQGPTRAVLPVARLWGLGAWLSAMEGRPGHAGELRR